MPLLSVVRPPWRLAAPAAVILILAAAVPARAQVPPEHRHDRAAVFAPADSVLDLESLVRAVLERNPSYAAAAAAVREADARADRAGALDDPMLELGVAPRSLGSSNVDAGWRASITQPLPLFGRRGLMRRVEAAGADVARGDLALARLDLVRATREAFYADYHDEQAHLTALQALEWMRRARAAALARYAAGTAQQQDVLAADVEIAMLDHQAVVAERDRLLDEARLRSLLHLEAQTPLPAPPDTLPLPDREAARLLVARSDERTRPELRIAEAEIEAQRLKLALARRERLPQTRLGVGYDRTMAEPEYRPMVMLSLEAPLAPGRSAAARREAQAALDGAAARRDATRDELSRRVTEASTQFEESLHELEVLRDGWLPAAERSQQAARAAYEAGRGDFDSLIRAVRDVLSARLEYHRTLAAVNQAHADLERALGGPAPAGKEQE
jgi:outer membrane protein, heavy metal efflux system